LEAVGLEPLHRGVPRRDLHVAVERAARVAQEIVGERLPAGDGLGCAGRAVEFLDCHTPTVVAAANRRIPRARSRCGSIEGEDAADLVARLDLELPVDLAQVVVDGARTDEEPFGDLGVGGTPGGEAGDLELLWCQVVASALDPLARACAGREELD